MDGYNCYLPSNLNVDTLLGECPPRGINRFNKDKLIYTMGLINQITANNKDLDTPNGFVPVNANTLRNNIRNYNQYLDYTVKTEIYESDNTYFIGKKSTGYKYTPKYDTTIKSVSINDNSFIKKLRKPTLQDYINQKKYHYLYKWFNPNLRIDEEKAMDCAINIYNHQKKKNEQKARKNLKRNLININRISNHDYILSVDGTVGRFHTNITLLKSELRQFLTYDNQPLVSLDIANAQPYFSTILFNPEFWKPSTHSKLPITYFTILNKSNHKFNINLPSPSIMMASRIKESEYQDIARFNDLVSKGQFYEYLQHKVEKSVNVTT